MNLRVIDTHAHLDMPHFDEDREATIARAVEAGVGIINTIGIDVNSSQKAIELAEKHSGIVATVGIHPGDADRAKKVDIDKLIEIARHPKVVALGEMGLDFYHKTPSRETQVQVLNWELEMARKVGLPIIIHCREAQETMLPMLQKWVDSHVLPEGKPRGILHCFSGDRQTAKKYLEMGFYISLGGYIGYPSSTQLREVIKDIPDERLVLETDCPFLPPQKYRGKRNEPSYILITLGVLAEIKGLSSEEMAKQTTQNAVRLFNLNKFITEV